MYMQRFGRLALATRTACRSVSALSTARCQKLSNLASVSQLLKPMHLQVAQFGTSSEDTGNTVVGRCEANIANALKPTHLRVRGMHDDPNGSHIIVEVVSEAFEGKNPVMRQRMVYKALWEEMSAGGSLHAVDGITAMTPAEYAKKLV